MNLCELCDTVLGLGLGMHFVFDLFENKWKDKRHTIWEKRFTIVYIFRTKKKKKKKHFGIGPFLCS